MDFYERWILPPLLDLVMRRKDLTKYRRAARSQRRVDAYSKLGSAPD